MDRSDLIRLISQTKAQDENGVWRSRETARDVFCNVKSVTAKDFFEGGRNGLNPAYVFTMFFPEYSGETVVEYNGQRYAVYRVYRKSTDTLELHVQRKGGTNARGKENGQTEDS